MSSKIPDFTTIDQCLPQVEDNRFKLAVIVSKRAQEIANSSNEAIFSRRKSTVVALHELSEGILNVEGIKQKIITSLQKHKRSDRQISAENIDDMNKSQELGDQEDELSLALTDDFMLSEADLMLSDDDMSISLEEEEYSKDKN